MPKLIDHHKREEELGEATWRVIMNDGIAGVSIRAVAAEAGVSTGSLRYSFPSKTELLVHAMSMVETRVRSRIAGHVEIRDTREMVLAMILEFMPLDAERRAEMDVNVALIAQAGVDPHIARVRDEAYAGLREGSRLMLCRLQNAGLFRPELDLDVETTNLHALIDGLALHMLMRDDEAFNAQAVASIAAHLDSLA